MLREIYLECSESNNDLRYNQTSSFLKTDIFQSEMFKLGQAIEARWIDKRFYPAKIIAIEENGNAETQ